MTLQQSVTPAVLERLRQLDTPTICNAVERFPVRLRNEGFTNDTIRCQFPSLPPVVGYAATGRIRSSTPPMTGRCYFQRMDWWRYLESIPSPRFVVLQDVDHNRGIGALFGEIHTHISIALNCVGYLTNGTIRDLNAIEPLGFQMFTGGVAVSHAYAHIVEFGEPVEIGGLKVVPGDLLHGDRHGVVSVPGNLAASIADTAREMLKAEKSLIELCQSAAFSLDALERKFQSPEHSDGC